MDGLEDTIRVEHLPILFRSLRGKQPEANVSTLRSMAENSEKEALLQAIRIANNNKNKAANILGIHRTALYKKMKKFNLPINPI
jgi:transcriptional regulator with PAS, ATPase and Fis domain